MSVNTTQSIRADLLEIYDRLEQITSLRARTIPNVADQIVITEGDYKIVNPMIKEAIGHVATETGAVKEFDISGLDALTEQGLVDWKIKISEGNEDLSRIIAVYRLPKDASSGYVPAVHEKIYKTIINYVLCEWFKGHGQYDVAGYYEGEYTKGIQQARNASPHYLMSTGKRRPVNL